MNLIEDGVYSLSGAGSELAAVRRSCSNRVCLCASPALPVRGCREVGFFSWAEGYSFPRVFLSRVRDQSPAWYSSCRRLLGVYPTWHPFPEPLQGREFKPQDFKKVSVLWRGTEKPLWTQCVTCLYRQKTRQFNLWVFSIRRVADGLHLDKVSAGLTPGLWGGNEQSLLWLVSVSGFWGLLNLIEGNETGVRPQAMI